MEIPLTPVVIFIILVVVIIGNVAALKHASHLRLEWMEKKQGQKSDLEKLTELDKKHHPEEHQ
ncbi:DUF2897 domain-containing protein [Vibrio albus]|jgi:hypothetical protein|uniref:DUF2897 domain-containing protein n=1 Tax=Vibrio albus TaxID=2200953 RepID=A0A2U3BCD6_9VIBR|nr:DUF2897 family protein [Vibrio albus]PWI34433.1 DUF2897 domain-containing protein [Vibrio albus]